MGVDQAEHGFRVGRMRSGRLAAITDVAGVHVGHTTLSGGSVRSGVTAIVPTQLDAERHTLPAAIAVGNGHGKLVGATQVDELGTLETAILLTSTLSVHRVADALLTHELARPGREDVITLNPLVGETNDGRLSDIRSRPVHEEHVLAALTSAASGPVEEGCVGAGTGTCALGFKGGIGTASRVAPEDTGTWTVGVLVQSNFGGTLRINGVPMPAGELLDGIAPKASAHTDVSTPQGNSCMIVVATDAPADARQLGRITRRAVFAMDRVGADFAHGSGDYAIAFTTHDAATGTTAHAPDPTTGRDLAPGTASRSPLPDSRLDPLFAATMEAVEEALVSSLVHAVTTTGHRGHTAYALPLDRAVERLRAASAHHPR